VAGLLLLFAVMTWVERRTLAFMQFRLGPNRTGPLGILQPIADGIKLFFKEESMPAAAHKWAFLAAPALAVGTALLAVAVLPYGPRSGCRPGMAAGMAAGPGDPDPDRPHRRGPPVHLRDHRPRVYGVVLAGWSANNKYSLIGACAPRPRCSPTSSPSA